MIRLNGRALYPFLNVVFHGVHISIILFVLLGWALPSLRQLHLALLGLTLGSWFILGQWLGIGYCPISDMHWKLKESFGEGRPEGTYIHYVLQKLTGKTLSSPRVDKMTTRVTLSLAALSLTLWLLG